jgi:hypothetical protein
VALCLWRLRRVAAYENAATVAGIEAVAEETRNAALSRRHRGTTSPRVCS